MPDVNEITILISRCDELLHYFREITKTIEDDRQSICNEIDNIPKDVKEIEVRLSNSTRSISELRSPSGAAFVVVNDSGISISNGKGATVEMIDKSVAINKDGLVVI